MGRRVWFGAALALLLLGWQSGVLRAEDEASVQAAVSGGGTGVDGIGEDDSATDDAHEPSDGAVPDAVLDGTVIGSIEIRVGDIFDPELPGEDRLAYRLANRLHHRTRDPVIQNQLLFKEGDRYDSRLVEESARLLREKRYLRDAEIIPVRYDGNRVDLAVVTREVWTLDAGFGLGRSGGVNSTKIQIKDVNLFGTGKRLKLLQASDVDRTSTEVSYTDPNLLGGRWQMDTVVSNNSDGSTYGIDVGRPFFSLDSRWAVGIKAFGNDRVDSLYDLGEITEQFQHQTELFEVSGGLSRGLVENRARRWTAGLTYRRDRFGSAPGVLSSAEFSDDRTLVYPWIAFDSLQDDYLKARNQDHIGRVEDLELGMRAHARLGVSSTALGGTRDEAVFDALLGSGMQRSLNQTVFVGADLAGRWGGSGVENLQFGLGATYYWRNFGDHLFFATLKGNLAKNLDPGGQLLLGGDSGLRGYPLRYQAGERSLLLTLEQRFFTEWYPWKLFRVGAAVFFDAGGVWKENAPGAPPNLGLLKDIGAGLRLGSTRSGRGSVVHLDVAVPLDGDGSIRSLQWLLKSKESF